MSDKSFSSGGGYRWLDAWVLANVVQLATQRFCQRFLTRNNDPCGRQFDQMTQAARSGVANIAEGYARRTTSKETEMRLYDTAKASLDELAGDYRNWLMLRGELPWSETDREERAVFAMPLDKASFTEDVERNSAAHILARDAAHAAAGDAPMCPKCGKPMRKRVAKRGENAGNEFWSCTGCPECNGTRSVGR